MARYRAEIVHDSYRVADTGADPDDLGPLAVCGCAEHAAHIADALNLIHDLEKTKLVLGTVWEKAGIRRAIIGVGDKYVHYETGYGRGACITRTDRNRFIDWLHGAKLYAIHHPTRRLTCGKITNQGKQL